MQVVSSLKKTIVLFQLIQFSHYGRQIIIHKNTKQQRYCCNEKKIGKLHSKSFNHENYHNIFSTYTYVNPLFHNVEKWPNTL